MLGVFRRREDEEADDAYRRQHRDTVTVHVDKNKRPPNRKGTYDYHLDAETGRIRSLRPEDFVQPGVAIQSASVASAALTERRRKLGLDPDVVIDMASRRHEGA